MSDNWLGNIPFDVLRITLFNCKLLLLQLLPKLPSSHRSLLVILVFLLLRLRHMLYNNEMTMNKKSSTLLTSALARFFV